MLAADSSLNNRTRLVVRSPSRVKLESPGGQSPDHAVGLHKLDSVKHSFDEGVHTPHLVMAESHVDIDVDRLASTLDQKVGAVKPVDHRR